ncbi:MAG TPA: ThiF family adenylyltransferase [Candidatus Saccharimonadales bacterium]|jgi:hypothetical protein
MKADYTNQTDIFDPDAFVDEIHLIGCGGIGSAVLFPLLKLGVRTIHVWDRDDVEPHNIPAQLIYRPSDIGMSKVDALCAFVERQEADCEVIPHDEFVTAETPLEGIVISGVDNMAARQDIWTAISAQPWLVPLYMDGRIGEERLQLLTLNPSVDAEMEAYLNPWMFPQDEGMPLPCAARTCIHPPTVLAGLVVTQLTLYMREEKPKENIMFNLKAMQPVISQ